MYVTTKLPALTPVKTPDDVPIVARAVLLLAHVPPEGVEERPIVPFSQTCEEPVIVVGDEFTTIDFVTKQPVERL